MTRIYHALKRSEEPEPCLLVELLDRIRHEGPASSHRLNVVPEALPAERTAGTDSEEPPEAPVSRDQPATTPDRTYKVANVQIAPRSPILQFTGPDLRISEQYRILRTNIIQHPTKCSVIAITSAVEGDGKTVTSINLGGIFALRSEARVLLIDGDLRKRGLSTALGLGMRLGLGEVLKKTVDVGDAIVRLGVLPELHVLPAGRAAVHPMELLDSPAFTGLVAALREEFTYIFFDTPPSPILADFKLIQKVCDGVVLVARPDHTERVAFRKAIVADAAEKFLGVVVNGFDDWFLWKTRDSYRHENISPPGK